MAHPQIAVFARLAKGGEAAQRVIFGQGTHLSRTMHDIRYSEKRDEIFVANPFAQAIVAFKGDASGDATPIRIIQGPQTKLSDGDTLAIDDTNNEVLEPQGSEVSFFPIDGNGDIPPSRVLYRPTPNPGWSMGGGIAIDPVHDLMVTDGTLTGKMAEQMPLNNPYRGGRDTILIFNRKGNGPINPIRIIRGDKTGLFANRQLQIYPEGGWIIITQITDGGISIPKDTFVGVWSIYDNGDVPPRWRIDGKPSNVLAKPRGVTYDPKHQEIIVSDMRLNAVLTFSLPEMFNETAKPPASMAASLR